MVCLLYTSSSGYHIYVDNHTSSYEKGKEKRMKKKRFLALLLVLVMLVSTLVMGGCGTGSGNNADNGCLLYTSGTPSGSEESDNTTEAGTSDTSVSDVKTGDANNMMAYIAAAVLALTAGVAAVSYTHLYYLKDIF